MSVMNMASRRARDQILARIRSQQGRAGTTPEEDFAAIRASMAERTRGPQPEPIADALQRFTLECEKLSTTLDNAASWAEVPSKIAAYLAHAKLTQTVVGWPQLGHGVGAHIDDGAWHAAGINYAARSATGDDLVGVTDCFCAIAETGTLVLLGSATTPKAALLPETHVCIVPKSRILVSMEDAFALIRKERGELPRATFLVSGPSRTADIEQTIVIGAHGPYRVHVIVVG
jgi:L-lactate dehydrogenase complex protein LldG